MDLAPGARTRQAGAGTEEVAEGEGVRSEARRLDASVQREGRGGRAAVCVAAHHDVVHEEVWVGDSVEHLAGVVHAAAEGAHAREQQVTQRLEAGGDAIDDEVSMDLLQSARA